MSDAYPVACRATLMYAQDRPCFKHEKPYSVLSYLKDGATTTNLVWEHGEEEVFYNLRQSSEQVELDKHGFCFCVAPTEFADWGSRQRVEENYLPEVENILKREVSGADEVQIFDWRVSFPEILRDTSNGPYHSEKEPIQKRLWKVSRYE